MTTTAQAIIEAAYARSTASDAGKLAVDGEMIAYLNREYQSLFAVLASKAGDNTLASTTLTFSGSPASCALPTDIIDIVKIETSVGGRTYLIPAAEKDRTYHLAPAMYRQGNSIVSRGSSRGGVSDPVSGDVYNLFYKDAPAALTVLGSTLDVRMPVRYENILVLKLAIYLEVKDEGRNQQNLSGLRDELTDTMQAFGLITSKANTARESANVAQNESQK